MTNGRLSGIFLNQTAFSGRLAVIGISAAARLIYQRYPECHLQRRGRGQRAGDAGVCRVIT